MDVTALLTNARSPDQATRQAAEAQIEQAKQTNLAHFMFLMATELANEVQQLHVRQLAGVVLKNCVSAPNGASSEQGQQRAQQWMACGAAERGEIKSKVLGCLASPAQQARHTAAQVVSAVGIIAGVLTLIVVPKIYPVRQMEDVEKALKGVLVISTVIMTPIAIVLSAVCLPAQFELNNEFKQVQWWYCAVAICLGLWSGLIIGFITEYYTSASYSPVREIAETQKQSAATGIIYGLALGYLSCIIPVICLSITILISHTLCGMFGVALGALGMLGTMTMGLTIDRSEEHTSELQSP